MYSTTTYYIRCDHECMTRLAYPPMVVWGSRHGTCPAQTERCSPRRPAPYSKTSAHRAGSGCVDVERLISLKEAADRYAISYSQLRLLARRGRLETVRLGRHWYTTPEAVAAYLANPELR